MTSTRTKKTVTTDIVGAKPVNESLLSLVTSKRLAEDILREDGGEITESNDLIWQEKSLALKDKLDAYGFVFTEFDSQEAKLKYKVLYFLIKSILLEFC